MLYVYTIAAMLYASVCWLFAQTQIRNKFKME